MCVFLNKSLCLLSLKHGLEESIPCRLKRTSNVTFYGISIRIYGNLFPPRNTLKRSKSASFFPQLNFIFMASELFSLKVDSKSMGPTLPEKEYFLVSCCWLMELVGFYGNVLEVHNRIISPIFNLMQTAGS